MAKREDIDQATANQVVQESLGLSMEDLGGNPPEDGLGGDDDNQLDPSDTGGDDLPSNPRVGAGVDSDEGDEDGLFETPQENRQQQRQPEPRQEQPRRPIAAAAEVRLDHKGNLVDKSSGKIVAYAGREARYYQGMHKARQDKEGAVARSNDLEQRLNKAVELGTQLFERLKEQQANGGEFAPEKHELSASEAREAYSFAREAKKDPVGTIKKLLTRAAAGGIDLSSIGLAGGNFDPKSLMDLVRQEMTQQMRPLQERTQRETEQETRDRVAKEERDATTKELTDFLGKNPEARNYLPVFQQVYSQPQFQHMTLGEVWARLQLNLLRRDQTPQRQQRPQDRQQRNARPPRGQSRPPQGGPTSNLAPVSMSYEEIVRGLLPPSR